MPTAADPRVARLADVLVSHSTKLKPGEKVFIETFDASDAVMIGLIERARRPARFRSSKRARTVCCGRALYQNAATRRPEDRAKRWISPAATRGR